MRRAPGSARRPPLRAVASAWIAAALAATVGISACTVGPSVRPRLATSGSPGAGAHLTSESGGEPTASTQTPRPTGPGGPGRTAPPLRWHDCADVPDTAADGTVVTIRCAEVTVPVSYPQPRRGSLQLHLAQARTPEAPTDAPPLMVLPGDPGTFDHREIADITAGLPAAIRDQFAITTFDPRGTGNSAGIDCVTPATAKAMLGMAADPTTPAGGQQLRSIARQLTFDCGDSVGPALTQINSTNAADDLDTVRAALGVDTLSLIARGGSATIGAVYATRYPGRVGAMVLDSPSNPLVSPADRAASSAQAASRLLADFVAACADFSHGCPVGPDPAGAITDLVDTFATSGDAAGDWVITGGSVLMALLRMLPDRSSWPELADAIAALSAGDAQPLADLVTASYGGESLTEQLTGHVLYTCNDTAARLSPDRLAEAVEAARDQAPLFGPYVMALAGWCSAWPAPDEAVEQLSGQGAAPIVVIGSVDSPRHPYRGAHAVAERLASATLISWQSGSTGGYPTSACVRDAVDTYLLESSAPPDNLLCPP